PPRDRRGAPSVWRTGRTEIIAELSDDALAKVAGSREQLTALRALHVGAVMVVPLRVRDDTIGSLTFIGPRGGRAFDNADRVLAEQIAAGAAFAIDNAMRADERARSIAAAEVALAERLAFMSSLSHGLRTPLHAIFGYAQLLAEGVRGPLTGDQQHDVQRIQANERHLLNLVDSVIAFARWDDGENLITEDVPVHDAVASARRATEASAAARHIISGVSGDSVDRDIYVRADATRLEEILLQLMTNAVRFSRPGATVTVDARVVGDCVWIRVTDTGIGIAEEDLGLVFQPFVRGRNALARAEEGRREGRGLGLAISRKLARAMGGEVSVVSQEGVGSAFTLALPRGRAPHAGNEYTLTALFPARRTRHERRDTAQLVDVESKHRRRTADSRRASRVHAGAIPQLHDALQRYRVTQRAPGAFGLVAAAANDDARDPSRILQLRSGQQEPRTCRNDLPQADVRAKIHPVLAIRVPDGPNIRVAPRGERQVAEASAPQQGLALGRRHRRVQKLGWTNIGRRCHE